MKNERSEHCLAIALALTLVLGSGCGPNASSDTADDSAVSPTVRADLAAIREIEDHRLLGDARLRSYLQGARPSLKRAAAIAVGRIGDASLLPDVIALVQDRGASVREGASLGLALLGGSDAERALVQQIGVETNVGTKRALVLALGHVGSASSFGTLTALISQDETVEVSAAAAEALGTMIRNGVAPGDTTATLPKLLTFVQSSNEPRAIAAAFALAVLSSKNVLPAEADLTAALTAAQSPNARAWLLRVLAVYKTPTATAVLASAVSGDVNARVRADACRFIAKGGATPDILAALSAALDDHASAVQVSSATAIASLGPAALSLAPKLGALYDASSSAWVRASVLPAIAALDPMNLTARVQAGLSDSFPVELSAISVLGTLGTDDDVTKLLTLTADPDVRISAAAIEALTSIDPSRATPAVRAAVQKALTTADEGVVSSISDAAVAFGWKDFAAPLAALYDSFPGQVNLNGRLAIVGALGSIGSPSDMSLLQRGLADDERLVEQTAAASIQQLTGTDVSAQVRSDSVVHSDTPSADEIDTALASTVLLETTRGTITIKMRADAPLSACNFVRLVNSGFYDGLTFHRVVPNFVAQGGDPRADGSGGSDQLVREEISNLAHRRGTVGMATEGKDTGSSQFFINLGWNVTLDGHYTVFGEVSSGLDAADALEVGDSILAAVAF